MASEECSPKWRPNDWIFTVGNLDGDLDEVRISRATLDPLHPTKTRELVSDEDTVALYRFDPNTDDYSGNEYHFTTTRGAEIPNIDHGWVQASSSSGLLLYALVTLPMFSIPSGVLWPGKKSSFTLKGKLFVSK